MRIYTKTGDDGTTGLVGGKRGLKSDLRFETIGTVDELNACLGVCRSTRGSEPFEDLLEEIQGRLFEIGAELASPEEGKHAIRSLKPSHAGPLERSIDEMSGTLAPLTSFILPGGATLAAQLHFARTICRRAERRVTELANRDGARDVIQIYLNRLSDWLFVAARTANQRSNVEDIKWKPEES